ncbi:hypothetical protein JI742_03340 [Piscinibacter sp. Jin2]|uniref:Uncharacterized protein n=1 Tax=Aquariibacter lacus TaxID=2801332 RepID=A0A9X0XDF7_9BURK|nr:hypothetical protein [Piscinibacter lacus]MBL0718916.1 hypothetical protein [Piscinibacter lacus]
MSPRLAQRLLIVQTLLLVLLLWGGVYFARDEFQLATEAEEEEIPTADHLRDVGAGAPQVVLSATAQRHVDLQVAPPEAGGLRASRTLRLEVLDAQALLAPRQAWLAASAAEDAARLARDTASREAARMQALHADGQQVSTRALEAAQDALARAELARAAAETARRAAAESAQAAWGPRLGAWLVAPEGSPGAQAWARLIDGRDVLLRAAWPAEAELPASAELELARADLPPARRRAEALGAAPAAAAGTLPPGLRALLFRAGGGSLSAGQVVDGHLLLGPALAGAWVPASALIWHAGQPWVYRQEALAEAASGPAPAGHGDDDDDDDELAPAATAAAGPLQAFRRQALPGAEREPGASGRWFLPGFDATQPVVVRGAQLLLSEEQKGLLKNENDD